MKSVTQGCAFAGLCLFALGLLSLADAPLRAGAIPLATATLVVDQGTREEVKIDIPVTWDEKAQKFWIGDFHAPPVLTLVEDEEPDDGSYWSFFKGKEYEVMVSGSVDYDPSIGYGIAVTDVGAPSSFLFLFSSPIAATPGPTVVASSIVGGLQDATGDGVSVTPTFAALQLATTSPPASTTLGVDVGPAVSGGPGAPGAFYSYGSFAVGPIAGPGPGPFTQLDAQAAFKLSGGGDIFTFNGFASINTVPEPSSFVLLGVGAVAIGFWGRKRAKRG